MDISKGNGTNRDDDDVTNNLSVSHANGRAPLRSERSNGRKRRGRNRADKRRSNSSNREAIDTGDRGLDPEGSCQVHPRGNHLWKDCNNNPTNRNRQQSRGNRPGNGSAANNNGRNNQASQGNNGGRSYHNDNVAAATIMER